jgi:SAM-dependent methyltransferase
MSTSQWDQRYSEPGLAYGSEPNEFLASVASQLPRGPVLTIGEGEGRNALFLASLGYDVVAVDQSDVGLAKARERAAAKGHAIETRQADLREFPSRGTGGPPSIEMMPSLATLKDELAGLDFLHARELEREVREGAYHTGLAAVVQIVARRRDR